MDGLSGQQKERERARAYPTLPAGVKDFSPFIQFRDLLEDFIQFIARVHISVHLQVTGNITSAFCSSPITFLTRVQWDSRSNSLTAPPGSHNKRINSSIARLPTDRTRSGVFLWASCFNTAYQQNTSSREHCSVPLRSVLCERVNVHEWNDRLLYTFNMVI